MRYPNSTPTHSEPRSVWAKCYGTGCESDSAHSMVTGLYGGLLSRAGSGGAESIGFDSERHWKRQGCLTHVSNVLLGV